MPRPFRREIEFDVRDSVPDRDADVDEHMWAARSAGCGSSCSVVTGTSTVAVPAIVTVAARGRLTPAG